MKITIDTATDTYERAAATLRVAFSTTGSSSQLASRDVDSAPNEAVLPGNWTRERLVAFVEWIRYNDAAEAIRFIAASTPAVSIDDVITHVGKALGVSNFSGQMMGGRMASVGFAVSSIPGVTGNPYETDYKHRMYRMDERIAEILLELLGHPATP